MGVYNDYANTNRTTWEFTYTGAELLGAARSKYADFLTRERDARERMAKMMVDMSVTQSDPRIAECKKEIEKAGTERERCLVWVHEFGRKPEQVYILNVGDVTYFDLAPEPADAA